jgi:hypothetical protein
MHFAPPASQSLTYECTVPPCYVQVKELFAESGIPAPAALKRKTASKLVDVSKIRSSGAPGTIVMTSALGIRACASPVRRMRAS